ncbi:MAG: 30S ribosomal protein S17e [Nanoarchaeota archaeon]|nr:30S ribosomal protein S17e [Nanoarchaeota archaeon]
MGRIKSKLIKRTGKQLVEKMPDSFGKTFEENKRALGNTIIDSKRIRNRVAGYITRLKKNKKNIIEE